MSHKWFNICVTFYSNLHKSNAYGASGLNLSRGSINNIIYVACPKDIPYGTKIYVEELGCTVICADRGTAIKWEGNTMKMDVYIENFRYTDSNKKQLITFFIY